MPNPTPQKTPSPTEKPTLKPIPTLLGALILVLAVVIAGILIIWATYQIAVPIATNIHIPTHTDPTANWQTYQNEEYGFEVKYPSSLTIKISSDSIIELVNKEDSESKMTISINQDDSESYESWKNNYSSELPTTLVDNIKGIELPAIGGCVRNLVVFYNGYEYSFYDMESGCAEDYTHIQDQIISTFKFIE